MPKVQISSSISCSGTTDVGKPAAITLTMGTGVYQYDHAGSLLDARCVQVAGIPTFRATVTASGFITSVGGSGNTGSVLLKSGVLTITAPATGTDTWMLTATATSNGAEVKVKFELPAN